MGKQVKGDGIFVSDKQAYHAINQFMRRTGATDLNYGCYSGGPSIQYSSSMHRQAVIWAGQHEDQMYVLTNAQLDSGTRVEVTVSRVTPNLSMKVLDLLKENPLKGMDVQEVRDCAADDF